MKKAAHAMQPIGPGDFPGMPGFPPVIALRPPVPEEGAPAPVPMHQHLHDVRAGKVAPRRSLADAIAEARAQRVQQEETLASSPPAAPACPRCRDVGFLVLDASYGEPDFGKLMPCSCAKQRTIQHDALHRLSDLALPGYQQMTFETFDTSDTCSIITTTYCHAQTYAQRPQGNFVLIGGYGTGKTHLATAIAHVRYAAGDRVLLKTCAGMLNLLRASFRDDAEGYERRLERIITADLLVIDDLGAERATEWADEQLFLIINERIMAQRPMVITSNQRPDALDRRIASRLQRAMFRNHLYLMLGADHAFGTVENVNAWYAMEDVHDQWLHELGAFVRGEGEDM
ncbi:MAG: AAA family ATPase [Candidatus Viridilinea halotolerans]|uniref:AAA family ATPase n=1 Tax=Candidatus Viridilinea halotolerans TaxID=2491704 RepID=A0A426U6J2_9CHLR|nr:MAG: AAA family ATPase [Candidatus Viridilinea halotolerans]